MTDVKAAYVLTADYEAENAAEIFTRSLRETGFGVIKNHPIDPDLVREVFAGWEEFFNSEHKLDYRFDPKKQDGYFPPDVSEKAQGHSVIDLKEYFHFYTWGRQPTAAGLAEKTSKLFIQMSQLGEELASWVEQYTPDDISAKFAKPLSEIIHNCRQTLLRPIHYPPLTGDEPADAVRAAEHGDINFLTLLPSATADGLQAKDVNGVWHDVPCDPGCIIVNVGDMLERISRGYYPSTRHRVLNPVGEAAKNPRLSMPLFLHGDPEVEIVPGQKIQDFLEERLRELGVLA